MIGSVENNQIRGWTKLITTISFLLISSYTERTTNSYNYEQSDISTCLKQTYLKLMLLLRNMLQI